MAKTVSTSPEQTGEGETRRDFLLIATGTVAVIGNVAATQLDRLGNRAFSASCGLYLDHYYLGAPGALRASKESGSEVLPLQPSR